MGMNHLGSFLFFPGPFLAFFFGSLFRRRHHGTSLYIGICVWSRYLAPSEEGFFKGSSL